MRIPIDSLTIDSTDVGIRIAVELTNDQMAETLSLATRPNDGIANIDLNDVMLSVRVRNCLNRACIYTVRQLLGTPLKKLRIIEGMGKSGIVECQKVAKRYGKELS